MWNHIRATIWAFVNTYMFTFICHKKINFGLNLLSRLGLMGPQDIHSWLFQIKRTMFDSCVNHHFEFFYNIYLLTCMKWIRI